jgi:hypothetical protein
LIAKRLVEGGVDRLHHRLDVADRAVDRLRFVFPVGQHMDGDEIDRLRKLAILEPELPDIGVGDRHCRSGLRTFYINAHRVGSLFPPQQHLVADDQSAHHVAVPVGQRDGLRQFDVVPDLVAAYPGAEQYLQSVLRRQLGNMVQALIHRIEPHAAGNFSQPGEIGVDALAAHPEIGQQGRFARTVVRCVRHALQPPRVLRRVELHIRHRLRCIALPQPQGQQRQCNEMHQRMTRPARRRALHGLRLPRPGSQPVQARPATGR